ncbi:ferredoxin-type protein NapF [Thiovibrio frasassiensis]|uniref:Ferredoxin-type protein NapF n=1 Tax=Thiovibrio frasassiensis TaxID=2984131 RepID=A0A9X4RLY6_9BACT|nr:ferredoxin-type protein NapF [Thiovibrio frasassiensis]MDG4475643.1 ferredoxin-type protein NapF [Thiovibrio frasassiensis]
MITNPDRRLFLRGGRPLAIRPPWSLSEDDFVKRCNRCRDCCSHCPQGILAPDLLGFPRVNFSKGPCTFCGACAQHCTPQALVMDTAAPPWLHKAVFAKTCLNGQGIPCRTCGEQCDSNAIIFPPSPGGRILPQLVTADCTGCGACYAVCPVQAIDLLT